jgi:sarcosine oxidase, subunit gamma
MADPFDAIAPIAIADRVSIAPCPPATRLIFRASADAAARVAPAFRVSLPTAACRAAVQDPRAALWLGPDEWLLLAPAGEASSITASIASALPGAHFSLVEVSDAHAALTVEGRLAATLLSAGCALDLDASAFPVGMCTRTLLAKATIVLWRQAPERFRVELRRSFASYGWSFLAEAAREHRVD